MTPAAEFAQAPADDAAAEVVPPRPVLEVLDTVSLGHDEDKCGQRPAKDGDVERIHALDAVLNGEADGDAARDQDQAGNRDVEDVARARDGDGGLVDGPALDLVVQGLHLGDLARQVAVGVPVPEREPPSLPGRMSLPLLDASPF